MVVGVFPPSAKAQRERLFHALEQAFPIHFEARASGQWAGLNGAIVFAGAEADIEAPCRRIVFADAETARERSGRVEFGTHHHVDGRLRGQKLEERNVARLAALPVSSGDSVLASCDGQPVWLTAATIGQPRDVAAAAPEELRDGEGLRDQLRAGRFLGLVPLIHMLREMEEMPRSARPPLRAAIVFDDPNLHSLSYGYLKFPVLANHAAAHRYHVAMASIPLDYRFVDSGAAKLFRGRTAVLSLAIHGNNHESDELLRVDSDERALRIAAQALRRTANFERRTGLSVSRVMCAPHEVCAGTVLRALLRLDMDAVCMETPLQRRPGIPLLTSPLTGWEPAQFIASGIPLVPRYPLAYTFDDVVLRAFLDQPLILFGHHVDVAGGLSRLEEVAAKVNALGAVEWVSLGDICRTNFTSRRMGTSLHVRLYSRRVRVPIPAGTDGLVVELPPVESAEAPWQIECGISRLAVTPSQTESSAVSFEGPFPSVAMIQVLPPAPVSAETVPSPPWRAWPVIRRLLTESRDRTLPIRHKSRRGAGH